MKCLTQGYGAAAGAGAGVTKGYGAKPNGDNLLKYTPYIQWSLVYYYYVWKTSNVCITTSQTKK